MKSPRVEDRPPLGAGLSGEGGVEHLDQLLCVDAALQHRVESLVVDQLGVAHEAHVFRVEGLFQLPLECETPGPKAPGRFDSVVAGGALLKMPPGIRRWSWVA
jgi:hypothetical protein